jgi:DNA end-binding protein Ku
MRSVWKGTIRIGQAAIPVKAYGATEEHGTGLHQLHLTDGGRIRYKRVCEVDGEEVPSAEMARGYEMPGGDVVVLTDEDFAKLPLSTTRSIDVRAFVPLEQIDPIYSSKSYHLEPEVAGTRSYVLFSEALQQSGRVAVVQVALRQRESLGVLRIRDQVMVLETMLWPDEIRSPDFPFLHQDVEVELTELREAASLIDQLSENFLPDQYTDHYRAALSALIEAKVEGNEIAQPAAADQEAGKADLLTALRTSLEEKQGKDSSVPAQREAAVSKAKAAAGKAAASKAAAKKAADKARTPTKSGRR